MKSRDNFISSLLYGQQIDYHNWPSVNIDALSYKQQELFLKRKTAVEQYIDGTISITAILTNSGLSKSQLYRQLKRCFKLDNRGEIWGYRALIPFKHIKSYKLTPANRNDITKLKAGLFQRFLDTYPEIESKLKNLYFEKSTSPGINSKLKKKYIWSKMLSFCKEAGIKHSEYPFNTMDMGHRSLERYLKLLDTLYFEDAAKRRGEQPARRSRIFLQNAEDKKLYRPFETVEFDGHKIDGIFIVKIITPDGYEVSRVLDRLWLLAIIDLSSRAILGYHLSLNKEYSAVDVLSCVRNSLVPWKPWTFSINTFQYKPHWGFHSGIIPETQWAVWDEMKIDNAKANLSSLTKDCLNSFLGCALNAGPVKRPEMRDLIERFFEQLEERGFHRLSNTTGHNPNDFIRNKPEKHALQYEMTLTHLEELLEILIAQYNGTPQNGIHHLSPLEAMRQRLQPELLRHVPEGLRDELMIISIKATRKVCGSLEKGRRPYINYENAVYTSPLLQNSTWLIGKKLTLVVNIEDLRNIKAFLPDGSELGWLHAIGVWATAPHSLRTRQEINRLKIRKINSFLADSDPINSYSDYLATSSNKKHTKSDVNKYARIIRETQKIDTEESVSIHEDAGSPKDVPSIMQRISQVSQETTSEFKLKRRKLLDD